MLWNFSYFDEFTVKGEGRVMEADVSGDLGYVWIAYTLTATPKVGSEASEEEGKSVFIVR